MIPKNKVFELLLRAAVDTPAGTTLLLRTLSIGGVDSSELFEHAKLLEDDGYIEFVDSKEFGKGRYENSKVTRITSQGHQYLKKVATENALTDPAKVFSLISFGNPSQPILGDASGIQIVDRSRFLEWTDDDLVERYKDDAAAAAGLMALVVAEQHGEPYVARLAKISDLAETAGKLQFRFSCQDLEFTNEDVFGEKMFPQISSSERSRSKWSIKRGDLERELGSLPLDSSHHESDTAQRDGLISSYPQGVWIHRDNENAAVFDDLKDALDTLVNWFENNNAHPSEKEKILAALYALQKMTDQGGIWNWAGIYSGDIVEKLAKDAAYASIRPNLENIAQKVTSFVVGIAGAGSVLG